MKMVYWWGLFLVSFLAGHFAANPWTLPVGRILLFLKIYISVMFVLFLLSEIIPYILKHKFRLEEPFQRTGELDRTNAAVGMQLSFASTGMAATAERHEQPVIEDKEPVRNMMLLPPVRNEAAVAEVPLEQTETTDEMAEQTVQTAECNRLDVVQKEAEAVLKDEAEFLAAIRGLELLPSVENETAMVEETVAETAITDSATLLGMENKEAIDDTGHIEETANKAETAENTAVELLMPEEITAEGGSFEADTGAVPALDKEAVWEEIRFEEEVREETIPAADAGSVEEAVEEEGVDEEAVEEETVDEEAVEEETTLEETVEEEVVIEEAFDEEAVEEETIIEEAVEEEPVVEHAAVEEGAAVEGEDAVIPSEDTQESFVMEGVDLPEFTSAIAAAGLTATILDNVNVPDERYADEKVVMEEAYSVEALPEADVTADTGEAAEDAAAELPLEEEITAEGEIFEADAGALPAVHEGTVGEETLFEEEMREETIPVADATSLEEAVMVETAEEEAVMGEVVVEEAVMVEIAEEEAVMVETAAEESILQETSVEESIQEETVVTAVEEPGVEQDVVEEAVEEQPRMEEVVVEETAVEERAAAEAKAMVIPAADTPLENVEILSAETDSSAVYSGFSEIPGSIDSRIVVVEAIASDADAADSYDAQRLESETVLVGLTEAIESETLLPNAAGLETYPIGTLSVPQRYTCRLRCAKPGGLLRGPILKLYCKYICQNGNY